MTLAEWTRALKSGMKLTCTYRWYWEKDPSKMPAGGRQEITVVEVKTTQMIYTADGKPERTYMYFPKASELKADENGFELYAPTLPGYGNQAGKLMSRYEWTKEVP